MELNMYLVIAAVVVILIVLVVWWMRYDRFYSGHPLFRPARQNHMRTQDTVMQYESPAGLVGDTFNQHARNFQRCLTDTRNRRLIYDADHNYKLTRADVVACGTAYGHHGKQYN